MTEIGRYNIVGEIGRGAMGVIYRAHDPAVNRTVAIKTIRLSDLTDPVERTRLRDRLFREAQSAGILTHPNIVTIYDVAEEGGLAYISMECVDGPTLNAMVIEKPPDAKLLLRLLAQMAAALDYAHKRGIIHRDIKPANIIVHNNDTAKIADFGVARLQSQEMTHAGALIGTPNYMSPEQIQGREVDGRSDQFSLGVIVYEMLAGAKPFVGESLATLVYKTVNETPQPVQSSNTTLSWAVDAVVQRALSKDPADRFPTCSDFIFALENACRSSKGWQPMVGGEIDESATLVGTPQSNPIATAVPAPLSQVPLPQDVAIPRPPLILRVARVIALVILTGGLASALLIFGARYFNDEGEGRFATEETTTIDEPSQAPPTPARSEKLEVEEGAPPRSSAEAVATTQVRLITNPSGATLTADGKPSLSCTSPCSLPLNAGRHTVVAALAGFRRTLRIVDAPGDEQVFLSLDRMAGTLMVQSEPRGATISINGQARAEKTPAMIGVPEGSYRVDLDLEGKRQTKEVVVKDSSITNVAVSFEAQ